MQQRSVSLVAGAFLAAGHPLTMKELTARTGLALATVTNVLVQNGARSDKQRPARWAWKVELDSGTVRKVPSLCPPGKPAIEIELTEADDWVAKWKRARPTFAKSISALQIDPLVSPDVLQENFLSSARALAGIAYALSEVKNSPDWFSQLGGELDEQLA